MSAGIDFLLPRRVDRQELREALAAALDARSVELVNGVENAIGDQDALAVVHEVRGEFRTHVSLFPRGDVETVKAVARALGTHALAPDDESPNPYAMLLIRYDGVTERVCLQADALERGEYRLG